MRSEPGKDNQAHRPADLETRHSLLLGLGYLLSEASTELEVSRIILETADRMLGWDAAFVNSYSTDDDILRPILSYDLVDGERRVMAAVTPAGPPSAFARPIVEGQARLLLRHGAADTTANSLPAFGDTARRSMSLLFAPIRMHGSTVGLISAQSYRENAYTEADVEVLAALADHCGGALRRAWAEARVRAAKETLEDTVRERTAELLALSEKLRAEVVERTRAEQVTRNSLHVLTSLIATVGGVAYETDPTGTTMQFLGNPAAVLPGLPGAELPCAKYQSLVRSSESLPEAPAPERSDLVRHDEELLLPDGSTAWVNHTSVPAFSPDAHRDSRFGVLLNITERKRAEQAARELREQEVEGLREENQALRRYARVGEPAHPELFADIITTSVSMKAVFHYLEKVGKSPQPLLILGETGTGKELVAHAAHKVSGRPGKFVACNIAGLDEEYFADTLFGHAPGAFTGATIRRPGLIEEAAGGTLFLDELGELSPKLQVKLLRLIQQREYYELGSDKVRHAQCSFIAATNSPIEKMVQQGLFREDLYFRFKTHCVVLPPLRERRQDIPLLVELFTRHAEAALGRPIPPITPEALAQLKLHRWPGNVRELQAFITDLLFSEAKDPWHLQRLTTRLQGFRRLDEGISLDYSVFPSLRRITTDLIEHALRRTGGNQKKAAPLLGITQQTLNERLRTARSE